MRHTKLIALGAASAAAIAAVPAAAQDYYLGQIIEVGNSFCPRNWATTDGQLLSIAQNTALFALLGTTYGGNGTTTFALPDLRGRMAISQGQGPGLSNYVQGQVGGAQQTTLNQSNLPAHIHTAIIETNPGNATEQRSFRNAFAVTADNQYATGTNLNVTMNSETITVQGAGETPTTTAPTMSPFLVNRFCIALAGVFPSRN